jgi:hypothetical protein
MDGSITGLRYRFRDSGLQNFMDRLLDPRLALSSATSRATRFSSSLGSGFAKIGK